ncbi:hypothetical protein GGQ87_000335 [Brevundimonas alba]|uniref:Uncharacterized protein n=1 Tax=Brevundimonas alba TaxID=74314 RepID=A0A7X5YHL7_9CAUL|nr:hypothetical protein [Brevundimonas alba]NJC40077.1 hypothetical protein [Brevundimonas alba]
MHANPKAGAGALIFGWVAYIALMAVHPTHLGGPSLGHVDLNDAVHWTALLVVPVLAYGYLELARWLGLSRALPLLGLSFISFSLFAGMVAGTLNGLVMPQVLQPDLPGEIGPDGVDALRRLVWWTNQGFSAIHYTLAAIATGVFGLAWLSRPGGRPLGVSGLLIAGAFLLWLASGTWRPDVHGALFVVLALGGWSISAAFAMRREDPADA